MKWDEDDEDDDDDSDLFKGQQEAPISPFLGAMTNRFRAQGGIQVG